MWNERTQRYKSNSYIYLEIVQPFLPNGVIKYYQLNRQVPKRKIQLITNLGNDPR